MAQQPQPQPQVNQILVTQTQQQGGGPPTKTIIILQQQPGPGTPQQALPQAPPGHQIIGHVNQPGQPQKVIMTNQQGQQMIVTQVPRPVQHQIIVNPSGGVSQIPAQLQMQSQQQSQPQAPPQMAITGQIQHQTIQVQKQTIQQPPKPVTQHQQVVMQPQQQIVKQHPPQPQQQQQHMGKVTLTKTVVNKPVPQSQPSPIFERKVESPVEKKVFVTGSGNIEMTEIKPQVTPVAPPKTEENDWDPHYLWVCEWRGCQK